MYSYQSNYENQIVILHTSVFVPQSVQIYTHTHKHTHTYTRVCIYTKEINHKDSHITEQLCTYHYSEDNMDQVVVSQIVVFKHSCSSTYACKKCNYLDVHAVSEINIVT